jgi:SAM-dependent methyltransferase
VRERARRWALRANRLMGPPLTRLGIDLKRRYELAYWRSRRREEGTLRHHWYRDLFTTLFDLPESFYDGKRMLDIGCGPRGSLEWATGASRRVGLDPLVPDYRALGIDGHEMEYVAAPAEAMPFEDASFDVVTSINSLDHVDDLDVTLAEIARVLAPGGTLLVAVDVHPHPTIAEPQVIPWELAGRLGDAYVVVDEQHLEKARREGYGRDRTPFDHDDPTDRYGTLLLRAERRSTVSDTSEPTRPN